MKTRLLLPISLGLLTSCAVDPTGLPGPPLEVTLDANYACAGAERSLSWIVNQLERGPEYCAAPNGGYPERRSCDTSDDCSDDGACIDDLCVLPGTDPDEIDRGAGCYEDISVRVAGISVDGTVRVVADRDGRRGSVSVTPEQSTTYIVTTEAASGVRERQTIAVNIVPDESEVPPPFEEPLIFQPPNCQPFTTALTRDLRDVSPTPLIGGGNVVIRRVTNLSGYDVIAATDEPIRGPIGLSSGRSTEALNGVLKGKWTVEPAVPSLSPAPAPDCTLAGAEPAEPVTLLLDLVCIREE